MTTYNSTFNGKILTYFRERSPELFKSTNGWYRLDCPFCFGNKSFGINIFVNKAKCHKCDYNNRLIDSVKELEEKETFNNTLTFLDGFDGDTIFKKSPKVEKKELALPDSFRLIGLGKTFLAKTARGYCKKRGFNIDYLTSRGVGYCEEGRYEGSLIFPFYYNGKLVYYSNRRFIMTGRKFDNPSEEEFGIGKSKLIYNRDALYLYKKIYLVESVTNALTLKDRAISLGGKTISTWQYNEILKSPVEQIDILLDMDAFKVAVELALKFVSYKKVRLIYWPGNDDVNKMGYKKTIEIIKQFKPQTYIQLNSLKRTYEYNKGAIH